jgi:Zn-dependent protease with chaperone function
MKFTVHYKEKLYFVLMSIMSLLIYGGMCIGVYFTPIFKGEHISVIAFFILWHVMTHMWLIGYLKSNAIKISNRQFPEAFALLKQHAKALELTAVPEMYLLEGGGIINAFATRFSGRNFIVLYSDVLELAYKEGLDAVSFIIGHEIGHIKRNHVGFIRSWLLWPATFIPFLNAAYSRACESTCDNIGYSLCPQGAARGILILAAGKHLYTRVDIEEFMSNAKHESGFATWFAEIFASHPALAKRVAAIKEHDRDNLRTNPFFVSPKINVNSTNDQLQQ